jgi:hypothetical protein
MREVCALSVKMLGALGANNQYGGGYGHALQRATHAYILEALSEYRDRTVCELTPYG